MMYRVREIIIATFKECCVPDYCRPTLQPGILNVGEYIRAIYFFFTYRPPSKSQNAFKLLFCKIQMWAIFALTRAF